MKSAPRFLTLIIAAAAIAGVTTSCRELNNDVIPSQAVNIDLSNAGLWSVYGVDNYGESREFILSLRYPPGFNYSYNSATGYGGVLLVMGIDPASGVPAPLAYDLSCPVERQPDIRVSVIDSDAYEAVCDVCGSHYAVTNGIGNAVSGPALELDYGLRVYHCYPTINGGYIITN